MEESLCDCGKARDPKIKSDVPVCQECWNLQTKMFAEFKKNKTTFEPSIDKIIDYLYLGNEDAAINKQILQEKDISRIVIAGSFLEKKFPGEMEYLELDVNDATSDDIKKYFIPAYQFIDKARKEGKTILVHCAAGVSRSAAIVTSYLMIANKWGFEQAYQFVKNKRSIVCVNSGFKKQLEEFERELKEGIYSNLLK